MLENGKHGGKYKKKSKYKLTNDYNMFYYLKLNELIELCSKIFFF